MYVRKCPEVTAMRGGMHGILSGQDTGTPWFSDIPGMIPAGWEFTNTLCIFLYKPSLLP